MLVQVAHRLTLCTLALTKILHDCLVILKFVDGEASLISPDDLFIGVRKLTLENFLELFDEEFFFCGFYALFELNVIFP